MGSLRAALRPCALRPMGACYWVMSRTGFSTESTKRSNPLQDPKAPDYPKPPFRSQRQPMPGLTATMSPVPDHGEKSYKGAGQVAGSESRHHWWR